MIRKVVISLIALTGIAFLLINQGKQSSFNDTSRQEEARGIKEKKISSGRETAPDFILPALDGSRLRLSDFKGKVVILDFWATRCPPCRKEIPGFIELYKKYEGEGLEIVGVCLESETTVKPFAKETGINYTLVFANREIGRQYGGIQYIPTTFIINRQGNIAKKHVGYVSKETFEKGVKELLSRKEG